MDNFLSQEIFQIHLDLPSVDLIILKNCHIHDSQIQINKYFHDKIIRPTMYKSWTEKVEEHLSVNWIDDYPIIKEVNSKTLLIFDTWGTSSYYHLLVDHILPIWITREWLRETYGTQAEDVEYFRISTNQYPTELRTIQDIFSYFLGKNFIEKVSGAYRNVVWGYFFNYRPYLGPSHPNVVFPNYRNWLAKFRQKFGEFERDNSDGPILVPLRITRNINWVDRFLQKYSHRENFMEVDFGSLTIAEQIKLSGSAKGIFGNEGAAFANMLFMPNNSLIIPVAQEADRFLFHSTLSDYIPHQFKSVLVDPSGNSNVKADDILRFLERGG
jgi:hypothetical protein